MKSRLQEEVDRAQRYGPPFSILLLDLDHFKSVNDAFGHSRGDEVLMQLAQRLERASRRSDIVFRYGGDEFIVLLPSTDKPTGIGIGQRLMDILQREPFEGQPALSLSCSMGIASFPEDAETPESLFNVADKRHFAAKRSGPGKFVSADEAPREGLRFENFSRLIERERALEKVYAFFEELPRQKQGTLEILGAASSGRSRFLDEVAKIARLQGFLVLPIRAKPALRMRVYGALLEAEGEWEGLPSIAEGETAFARALAQLVQDKGNIGVLFLVDEIAEMDRQSLGLLERLLFNPALPLAALASSNLPENRGQYLLDAPLQVQSELFALSQPGMRIWLRHVMQWEATGEFSQWLFEQTGGLPGVLQRALFILAAEGFIFQQGEGWAIREDVPEQHFASFPLAFRLEQERNTPKGNLPANQTTFVGRTRDIRLAKGLLETGALVNLLGPGGIGKSRLAIQIAAEVAEQFADGAFFIPLASVSITGFEKSLTPFISAIADALGITLSGQDEIKKQLLEELSARNLLLVMDNYEHLMPTVPFLAEMLKQAPRVKVIITSREPTNLAREKTLEIAGLPVPADEMASGARHYESVQLFFHSGHRVDQDFMLTENNLADVIKICKVVGGMPLGIELAAAWVGMFTCEEIAEQIGRNFGFLATTRQTDNSYHQNLRAVFDYFWELCSSAEQIILGKLSTFRSQFNAEAARQVAGASPFFLGALVNRVFLVKSIDGLYRMHDLLRQYAAEKLETFPTESAHAHQAHATYYLQYLARRTEHLRTNRQNEAKLEISTVMDNIQAAWNWAIQQHWYEALQEAADAMYHYFDLQGRYREGDTLFSYSSASLEEQTSLEQRGKPEFIRIYARIRVRYARFHALLGFYQEAGDIYTACLPLARNHNDRAETALILEGLGWTYYDLGHPKPQVKQLWEDSLAIYRELQFPWGISLCLYNLAFIAPLEEIQSLTQEKLELSMQMGDERGIADTLVTLGDINEQLGEYETGIENINRALQVYEKLDNPDSVGYAHYGLGKISQAQGHFLAAQERFGKALTFFRQVGNVNGMSNALARMCRAAMALGDFKRVHEGLENSLALERQSGSQIGIAYALNTLGELAFAEARLDTARELLDESCRILEEADDTWGLSRTLINLARLDTQEGHTDAAQQRARRGLDLATQLGETLFIHNAALALATAVRHAGDLPAARTHLHHALQTAQHRKSPPLILDTLLEIAAFHLATGSTAKATTLLRMILHDSAAIYVTRQAALQLLGGPAPQPEPAANLDAVAATLIEGGLDG